MESLIGYGSDDECDEVIHSKRHSTSQADANYEEVQMDLSEESNDSSKLDGHHQTDHHRKVKYSKDRSNSKDREPNHNQEDKDKYRRSPDDRYKTRKNEDDKYKAKDDRGRDYRKDRNRDDKNRYRDRKPRSDEQKDKRDDYRDERRSHRNSSRERHRSRSPKRNDYRNRRSNSRERNRSNYSKRYDRTSSKMDRLEKLGIELNTSSSYSGSSCQSHVDDKDQDKDRFFMPGITGRFTEQIQRRKMLWQKKSSDEPSTVVKPTAVPTAPIPTTTKVWQNTTFAQDTDGKVANKFKRLMGIKGNETEVAKSGPDTLKKQEEMFNSMEAQYEVARTATHTMRGVGLGFGSFQR